MKTSTVHVKKNDTNPESKEILAEAITRIGESVQALNKSGLNRDAIVILIAAKTSLAKRDIVTVLDALPRLRGWYCRP